LLQIWLYATRREGVYEKRYDELCQFLNIQQYHYESLIKRTLGPSLDELKQFGHLADWQIERTSDRDNFKIVFFHGEKFHRDRRTREGKKPNAPGAPIAILEQDQHSRSLPRKDHRTAATMTPSSAPLHFDPKLISELNRRGITDKKAYELLANLEPGQDKILVAQLEYAEQTVEQLRGTPNRVRNPAWFIISLIEHNATLPENFETGAQRRAREERERTEAARRNSKEARQQLEWEYDDYRDAATDRYIEANTAAFEALKDTKWKEDRTRFTLATESMARMAARLEMQKQITFLTFEEYLERKKQAPDFFLKSVGPSPATGPTIEPGVPEDLLAAEERRDSEIKKTEKAEIETEPRNEIQPLAEPAIQGPMMIELVSDPPEVEFGGDIRDQQAA
jgi:hypothetical protein